MTRRPRKLSPEERELWSRVASSAAAMHGTLRRPVAPPEAEDAKTKPKKTRPELGDFRIGQSSPQHAFLKHLSPSVAEQIARQPVVMDRKAHRNMTRGKLEPEARIDLHGMTLAQAHPELVRFIMDAQGRGCRLVLVITGKGRKGLDDGPIPQRQGVLRHQVPQWLRLPPLGAVVMQINPAHLKHGGSGAYYVYLRRNR